MLHVGVRAHKTWFPWSRYGKVCDLASRLLYEGSAMPILTVEHTYTHTHCVYSTYTATVRYSLQWFLSPQCVTGGFTDRQARRLRITWTLCDCQDIHIYYLARGGVSSRIGDNLDQVSLRFWSRIWDVARLLTSSDSRSESETWTRKALLYCMSRPSDA